MIETVTGGALILSLVLLDLKEAQVANMLPVILVASLLIAASSLETSPLCLGRIGGPNLAGEQPPRMGP